MQNLAPERQSPHMTSKVAVRGRGGTQGPPLAKDQLPCSAQRLFRLAAEVFRIVGRVVVALKSNGYCEGATLSACEQASTAPLRGSLLASAAAPTRLRSLKNIEPPIIAIVAFLRDRGKRLFYGFRSGNPHFT